MAALANDLPLRAVAALKRMFSSTYGIDPFAPLTTIRGRLNDLCFKFETGSFTGNKQQDTHFLRATDVEDVEESGHNYVRRRPA